VLREHREDLLIDVDEAAGTARDVLSARGFVVQRREHHYLVPTSRGMARAPVGFAFISAADCDVDRLRILDETLRQDVPGAAGWRNGPRRPPRRRRSARRGRLRQR
jgi:hypothetical protein